MEKTNVAKIASIKCTLLVLFNLFQVALCIFVYIYAGFKDPNTMGYFAKH